ncbi:MAG TPA: cupin domain-containing protein [Armatimonadota bacterium]|nr:cupin domain-containing protein [Armatimonadota bacterium]HOS44262.1 cupin domain-containing protein [Armatimonadota bacterium]
MGTYDHVELTGPARDAALDRLHAQMQAWGLTMPPVEPLPLHFGLHDFYAIGETEFWVANEAALGYCGKFLFVFDGQRCPFHRHAMKHETFFVVKGAIRMQLDDREFVMHEGDLFAMPPGMGHSFIGLGPALLLEVSMPSMLRDNFFADTRIGEDGVI